MNPLSFITELKIYLRFLGSLLSNAVDCCTKIFKRLLQCEVLPNDRMPKSISVKISKSKSCNTFLQMSSPHVQESIGSQSVSIAFKHIYIFFVTLYGYQKDLLEKPDFLFRSNAIWRQCHSLEKILGHSITACLLFQRQSPR